MQVVITDTSILIVLYKIGELELLKRVYGEIITTSIIAEEFGEELSAWIKIDEISDKKYLDYLKTQVDIGGASAFAVA